MSIVTGLTDSTMVSLTVDTWMASFDSGSTTSAADLMWRRIQRIACRTSEMQGRKSAAKVRNYQLTCRALHSARGTTRMDMIGNWVTHLIKLHEVRRIELSEIGFRLSERKISHAADDDDVAYQDRNRHP